MSDESLQFKLTQQNETAEILRKARALIDTPEKWCKGIYSRGEALCMEGALFNAIGDGRIEERNANGKACIALQNAVGGYHLPSWNDAPERTHADILAAFDKAIQLAESV